MRFRMTYGYEAPLADNGYDAPSDRAAAEIATAKWVGDLLMRT